MQKLENFLKVPGEAWLLCQQEYALKAAQERDIS